MNYVQRVSATLVGETIVRICETHIMMPSLLLDSLLRQHVTRAEEDCRRTGLREIRSSLKRDVVG